MCLVFAAMKQNKTHYINKEYNDQFNFKCIQQSKKKYQTLFPSKINIEIKKLPVVSFLSI